MGNKISFHLYCLFPHQTKQLISKGAVANENLQQPSHKIFDFVAYIDWFQGVKRPGMAVFDRQNQYSRDCR
ncbi:MAG: hypothetical protein IJA85_02340, partial [Clostridia bacterium]|nr:hypothetical protein [Clostridia bacterium]